MRPARLRVLTAIVIAMVTASCTGDPKSDSTQAGGVNQAGGAAAPAASAGAAAGMDEETKAACKNIDRHIRESRKAVAKAEKIGPPAGHHARSAAWSAAATSVGADSIGADESVTKAADDVIKAMSEIAGKYANARSKPDKTAVNRAIAELTKACSAN